jgi:Fur family peroxide stress response transcriptional regulator
MPISPAEVMLAGKGVKPTPQRVVITEYLMGTDCHPTADQILEAVSEKLPVALSRATVYNTLKTLVDAGVIQEVLTEPGRARYDANVSDHHHFVDVKTGQIMDVPHDAVPQLRNQLGGKFKVHNYTVTFFGELAEDQ